MDHMRSSPWHIEAPNNVAYSHSYIFIMFIGTISSFNANFCYFYIFSALDNTGSKCPQTYQSSVSWRLHHMESGIIQQNVTNGKPGTTVKDERYSATNKILSTPQELWELFRRGDFLKAARDFK